MTFFGVFFKGLDDGKYGFTYMHPNWSAHELGQWSRGFMLGTAERIKCKILKAKDIDKGEHLRAVSLKVREQRSIILYADDKVELATLNKFLKGLPK